MPLMLHGIPILITFSLPGYGSSATVGAREPCFGRHALSLSAAPLKRERQGLAQDLKPNVNVNAFSMKKCAVDAVTKAKLLSFR